MSAINEFRVALAGRGIIPPADIIADGKIHRADVEGKRGRSDASYVFHADKHPAGWFENHADGLGTEKWRARGGSSLPITTSMTAPVKAKPKSPSVESSKARAVLDLCVPATHVNGYIVKKGGLIAGLYTYPDTAPRLEIRGMNVAGWLVIPVWSKDKLKTLQFVPETGPKLNLPNASFDDGYFSVGKSSPGCKTYIAEGIGQAWAIHIATGAVAIASFGSGRMEVVTQTLQAEGPEARLVLVPDVGQEAKVEQIAAAVGAEWVAMPADKPGNYDANDYAAEFGSDALAKLLAHAVSPPLHYKVLSGAELCALPPMQWMLRGVLPRNGLAALYGPSGSGKSFLILDIAAAIAGGDDAWFGRRVTPCPVTYCALEGEAGMGKRIQAWSAHHKKPVPNSLSFVIQSVDLMGGGDVAELASAIQAAGGNGGLVILDTLNRAAPGADENSSVDMGLLIAASKRLQGLTGGLVLLVHHTGKDTTKGLRGHSSLYAALDAAIEVNRNDSRREWSVSKSKDDETGAAHGFKLEIVPLGFDDAGDEVTSCSICPDDIAKTIQRVKLPAKGNQKIALDTLGEPLRKSPHFGKDGSPAGHPCIRLDDAIEFVSEHMICDSRHKTTRAREAVKALVASGIYGVKGDWLWRV